MRPSTLAEMTERIAAGQAVEFALPEFLDEFYLAPMLERQIDMLVDEPAFSGDLRLDALVGAVAEYLAHQFALPEVPDWAFDPRRYLERAWHTSSFSDDGFREYLTFASPAEFSSRNIFTEESPLRRARSATAGGHESIGRSARR
jgi:hypothetical protein